MIKSAKVRLRPNKEQEQQLWKSAGVARFAYNWALARQKENYESGGKFLSHYDLRKEFTRLKQTEGYSWLYETSNNITKQAIQMPAGRFRTSSREKRDSHASRAGAKASPLFSMTT